MNIPPPPKRVLQELASILLHPGLQKASSGVSWNIARLAGLQGVSRVAFKFLQFYSFRFPLPPVFFLGGYAIEGEAPAPQPWALPPFPVLLLALEVFVCLF